MIYYISWYLFQTIESSPSEFAGFDNTSTLTATVVRILSMNNHCLKYFLLILLVIDLEIKWTRTNIVPFVEFCGSSRKWTCFSNIISWYTAERRRPHKSQFTNTRNCYPQIEVCTSILLNTCSQTSVEPSTICSRKLIIFLSTYFN